LPPLGNGAQHQGRFHIFQGREALQQVEELEHEPDLARTQRGQLAVAQREHVLSVEIDPPAAGAIQPPEQMHERRFAVPGRTDDAGQAAARDFKVHAAQGLGQACALAIGLGQALGLYD
jgi:hypothetical protein